MPPPPSPTRMQTLTLTRRYPNTNTALTRRRALFLTVTIPMEGDLYAWTCSNSAHLHTHLSPRSGARTSTVICADTRMRSVEKTDWLAWYSLAHHARSGSIDASELRKIFEGSLYHLQMTV